MLRRRSAPPRASIHAVRRASGRDLATPSRSALAVAALFVACGSRTGLLVPSRRTTAGGRLVRRRAARRGRSIAPRRRTASPSDPGYVYKCGQRVFQCSSLEQCEERESGAAVRQPVPRLARQRHVERLRVLRRRDGHDAGGRGRLLRGLRRQPVEDRRAGEDRGRPGRSRCCPSSSSRASPRGTGRGVTYAPYDAERRAADRTRSRSSSCRAIRTRRRSEPRPTRACSPSCPAGVTPAVQGDASLHGTGTASAFHIKTNVPVVAYQMLPYGGGRARVTGSTLLLPDERLGLELRRRRRVPGARRMITEARAGPTTVVIASQDGTHVTLKPTADDRSAAAGCRGTPTRRAGARTRSIRGQYLQFTQPAELTGTRGAGRRARRGHRRHRR